MKETMHETVKDYYGSTLAGSADLKTDACCTVDAMPAYLKPILAKIHPEVSGKYYGCGLVAPELLEGLTVLDLGSGTGQDCFVLSYLVGESGSVIGVDMTDQQLAVAERHIDYHREAFGYRQPNVRFVKGYIEKLDELGLAPNSVDVIVSNCVINLSPDKRAVLEQAHRLLKPGGEMYFSDVYADRRVPDELSNDPVLYGECLAGALYWNDFLNLARSAGFADPRLVTDRPLAIKNPEVVEKIGPVAFYSATYRLFKLDDLEPACEDYGQAVIYRGTVPHSPHAFVLDAHHVIEAGKVFPVCGNTWRMLSDSRFREHFEFIGDFSTHYGIFPGCGMEVPFGVGAGSGAGGGCC
jgi:SAM-dependent methyltransferase